MPSDQELRKLMQTLHRAAMLSERVGDKKFVGALGISRSHFLVLRSIADANEPVASQQWLADLLSLTKGAVSRHINNAQASGLVRISASTISRRENAIELTPAGKRVVATGRQVQRELERNAAIRITNRDIVVTTKTLETICQLLEEVDD